MSNKSWGLLWPSHRAKPPVVVGEHGEFGPDRLARAIEIAMCDRKGPGAKQHILGLLLRTRFDHDIEGVGPGIQRKPGNKALESTFRRQIDLETLIGGDGTVK